MQGFNKLGPAQVGAPLKFVKLEKDTSFKLLPLSQCQKLSPRNTLKHENVFGCFFVSVSLLFLQPKSVWKRGCTLRPNESFGKTNRAQKREGVFSTIIRKTNQFHREFLFGKSLSRKCSNEGPFGLPLFFQHQNFFWLSARLELTFPCF